MVSTSSTCTIELQPILPPSPPQAKYPARIERNEPPHTADLGAGRRLANECAMPDGTPDDAPADAVSAKQKWNESPMTIFRLVAVFWCFLVTGANDAAYGPLIPKLMPYYDLSYVVVSLVFLSPFVGYVSSAILNNYLHLKFGQRGISVIGSLSHLTAYIIIAAHPPYIALVFAFLLAGFGNGVADAAWNAWVGNLANSSEILGFLHAMYGVGAVISPFISTAMTSKADLPWYSFYYLMIGMASFELVILTTAFWKSDGPRYRQGYFEDQEAQAQKGTGLWEALFQKPASRVSWTCAFFLLAYVGVEVALGGWIVTFMEKVRNQDDFNSGMSAAGFWLGITIGRAVLGFVTPRIGIKIAMSAYIGCAVALELVFWLVPQFIVSAVAVSLQGFFLGPMFPGVVLVASKLLPRHQHVVVIGFASAFGGCGAAILPFVTGLLVQGSGPKVLQPIILAILVAMLIVWLLMPRLEKKKD